MEWYPHRRPGIGNLWSGSGHAQRASSRTTGMISRSSGTKSSGGTAVHKEQSSGNRTTQNTRKAKKAPAEEEEPPRRGSSSGKTPDRGEVHQPRNSCRHAWKEHDPWVSDWDKPGSSPKCTMCRKNIGTSHNYYFCTLCSAIICQYCERDLWGPKSDEEDN